MSTENQKIDIILDCDPGYDDAAAILLAAGNPNVNILAITVVAGNQSIAKVTRNALAIAQVAGLHDVPIAAGATRPLMIEPEVAAEIHGETGLDDATLPDEIVLKTDPRHAVQVIIDTVMSRPAGTVTLVPTGPLTNIALAARLEPRIVERVKEVVLMGGAVHTGNHGPYSEFNIGTDPEAADIVFKEKWKVVMVGLDLTYQERRAGHSHCRDPDGLREAPCRNPYGLQRPLPSRARLRRRAAARSVRRRVRARSDGRQVRPRAHQRRTHGHAHPRHDCRRLPQKGSRGLSHPRRARA